MLKLNVLFENTRNGKSNLSVVCPGRFDNAKTN